MIRLTDGALTLRAAGEQDASILAGWWNDGAVMAHAGFPRGLGTTEEAVCASLAQDDDARGRRLIMELGGIPIGEMNYRGAGEGAAEIGIKICDPAVRERGIGSHALRLLIGWLFTERGFERIILDTNVDNERAQHVYEHKLGFRKVGIRQNAWQDQDGVWQSAVDYELRREAYRP